jgi:hypothetical protein
LRQRGRTAVVFPLAFGCPSSLKVASNEYPPRLVISIVCFASIALADDFKTVTAKNTKMATVSRVETDGIVLKTKSGISKVYFAELPKEVQQRFHYDARSPAELMASAEATLRNG